MESGVLRDAQTGEFLYLRRRVIGHPNSNQFLSAMIGYYLTVDTPRRTFDYRYGTFQNEGHSIFKKVI